MAARGATDHADKGTFAPFGNRLFLAFWLASVVSNFGALIQGVGASWLMTSIAHSAVMVTLVTVATVFPLVLFSLLAGAAADVGDRRRIMLVAQTLMLVVSAGLAVLTYFHLTTPPLLLAFTFLLGCGTALNGPSAQASIGEIVSREDLAGAVSLNSLGFNIARAAGPAIGGLVVAAAGPEATFTLNAVTYLGLIAVLLRWRRDVEKPDLPPETIREAMHTGLRYAFLSPGIRTALVRAMVFGTLASALTALMPLIARDRLQGTSLTYGILLAAFGGGSVLGALASGRLRKLLSNEQLLRAISLVIAGATVVVGHVTTMLITIPALLLAGAAWVLALSMFNVIVQLSAPRWVVGRSMAVIQMTMFGGFALGGLLCGAIAQAHGLSVTLTASGAALALSAALGLVLPVATPTAEGSDQARRTAAGGPDVDPRAGPVVTTVRYRVSPQRAAAFVEEIWSLRQIRRRNGARAWAILSDLDDPEIWIERFESVTWLDHLRQTERPTEAEVEVAKRVFAFHQGEASPEVQQSLERSPGSFSRSQRPTGIEGSAGSAGDLAPPASGGDGNGADPVWLSADGPGDLAPADRPRR